MDSVEGRSEYLSVTGTGSTRTSALDHAARQAEAYFGYPASALDQRVGRAQADELTMGGDVALWAVDVVYRQKATR